MPVRRHLRPPWLAAAAATAIAVAAAILHAASAGSAADLRTRLPGRWQGTIGVPPETMAVFVDIDTLGAEGWLAEADIPAQGVENFPLGMQARADTVTFRLGRAVGGPTLSGVIDPSEARIEGLYTQAGTGAPARLVRTGPPAISPELREMSLDLDDALDVAALSPDARELRQRFNADTGRVRLVMLLSPT